VVGDSYYVIDFDHSVLTGHVTRHMRSGCKRSHWYNVQISAMFGTFLADFSVIAADTLVTLRDIVTLTLTFAILTLVICPTWRVTWSTSSPSLTILSLFVREL